MKRPHPLARHAVDSAGYVAFSLRRSCRNFGVFCTLDGFPCTKSLWLKPNRKLKRNSIFER